MASGSRVIAGWDLPGRGSGMISPSVSSLQAQANAQRALAPTQAAGPLGSSFGLGLPAGYASALTRYLDPAAMEAQIRADAQVAAGNAAADRGFGLGDNIGARLTGEIQAPALQAYRMNLLNQIPQFWQMEQQQKAAAQAEADRRREMAWEREQRGWALEDRRYQQRLQAEAERKYREAGAYENPRSATTGRNAPGGFDGKSGTGDIIGGPAESNSRFGQSNLTSSTGAYAFGPGKGPDRVFTETREQAEARGANIGGKNNGDPPSAGFDYVGSPNKNTGGYIVPGVSSAGPSVNAFAGASSSASGQKWWK